MKFCDMSKAKLTMEYFSIMIPKPDVPYLSQLSYDLIHSKQVTNFY